LLVIEVYLCDEKDGKPEIKGHALIKALCRFHLTHKVKVALFPFCIGLDALQGTFVQAIAVAGLGHGLKPLIR
jgi:hypothetical protein